MSTRSSRARGLGRPVRHDHLTSMLAVADADAPSVVEGYPGGAPHGIDQRVENGPIGYCIGSIEHPLRLAVGACHGARIQMIVANDDRRLDDSLPDQFIESQSGLGAFPVAQPANARRQTLERHAFPAIVSQRRRC